MGRMKSFFKKKFEAKIADLPSGSFTLDRNGKVVVSTLSQNFPEAQMRDIADCVMAFFKGAQEAQLPIQEINVYYPSLRITARNLSGGALIFLLPQTLPKN
jgi:hypothetical protein